MGFLGFVGLVFGVGVLAFWFVRVGWLVRVLSLLGIVFWLMVLLLRACGFGFYVVGVGCVLLRLWCGFGVWWFGQSVFACLVSLVDGLGFGLANSVVSSECGGFRCGYVVMLSYLWVWFAYGWCCVGD